MGYEVQVDKDMCISSGKCVADAPSAFRFDDEEISEPTEAASALPDAQLLEIARNCPSGAISLLAGGTPVSID